MPVILFNPIRKKCSAHVLTFVFYLFYYFFSNLKLRRKWSFCSLNLLFFDRWKKILNSRIIYNNFEVIP